MSITDYNRINPPKKTVGDYLHSLNNDELQSMYGSTLLYDVKLPGLIKKLKHELQKRKLNMQTVLF